MRPDNLDGEQMSPEEMLEKIRQEQTEIEYLKRQRTTTPGQGAAPNLIKELEPSAPDQVWASDITYVATLEGWLYLAVSTLKTECFPDNQVSASRAQARREIFEYIEVYYGNQRLHSALGTRRRPSMKQS